MTLASRQRRSELLALLSPERIPAPCPHFTEGCGGCLMQDVPYEEQVVAKAKLLEQLYGRDVPVHPCPAPLGYRNRMDFVVAFGKSGLRRQGKFDWVIDVKDCLLLPEHARAAHRAARTLIELVPHYNYLRHQGFLRYLVIRTSRMTKETMLIATTNGESEEFGAMLEGLLPHFTSIHWTTNTTKTDVSVGEPYRVFGKDHIVDEIGGLRFTVRPKTFFQANTRVAEDIFSKATSFAHGDVLDLFCGVGTLSMFAARNLEVTSVVGVDIVPESIEAAKENAQANGAACTFVCSDAYAYLKGQEGKFDTVICDPARPGLEKATALLLDLAPQCIIYVSCNPVSHLEDIGKLKEKYEVAHLEAYDQFPQTPHIEILSVLERK